MVAKVVDFPTEQQQPESGEFVFKPDDDQIAIQLGDTWRGKVAFFHSEWKVYENGCWRARDMSEMRRTVKKELRGWRDRGVKVSQNRIRSIAAMLEDDLFIADRVIMEKYEEQKRYVSLRNGLFNLDTMELEPHRTDLFLTTQLDFDYDEDADCPVFRRYLETSLVKSDKKTPDQDLITLVQQALGYSMTAETNMKASFWLVGQKDSGKSTFISLIKSIMGNLHTTLDLTQLGVNRFLLAGLVGKRVVTFTEGSSNTVLPDALYKALTGGTDEIYADVKNRDAIAFRPEAKIWWAMNDGQMPRIVDRSGATTRRLVIVPFNRTIPEKDRIDGLETKLMAERSGIFNQMVVFYKRLKRAGKFHYCKQSEDMRQEYITDNDTESMFVEECCDVRSDYRAPAQMLYDTYRAWCERNGFKPKSKAQMKGEWIRMEFVPIKNNTNWWTGLRLKEERINEIF